MDDKFLKQLVEICKKAGQYIREEQEVFDRSKVTEKVRFSDLVSYVDKTAEQMLVEDLQKLLPESGILAEEGSLKEGKLQWVIDPLDGTTNFVHGVPVYCVSVGLKENDQIICGVVYEIARDECFYARSGGGAYLNGGKIRVSNESRLSGSLLATGYPYYEFEKLDSYLSIMQSLMQQTQGLRRMGSAAADLAYTACGRFEAFFEYNLKPWDIAAGIILVKEAGGTVTDLSGVMTSYPGKKLSPQELFTQILLRKSVKGGTLRLVILSSQFCM